MANTLLHYGQCCCCLSKGHHRDMTKKFYWKGELEIYDEIIRDTFDIIIKSPEQVKLICSICITKLRKANTFRMLMIKSQQNLNGSLNLQTEFINVEEESLEIKTENIKIEQDLDIQSSLEYGVNDDYMDSEETGDMNILNEKDVKIEVESDQSNDAEISNCNDGVVENTEVLNQDASHVDLESSVYSAEGRLRMLLKDADGYTMKQKEFLKKLAGFPFKPLPKKGFLRQVSPFTKSIPLKSNDVDTSIGVPPYTEKRAHIQNIATVLKYTNAVPFKSKNVAGFPCYHCRDTFKDPTMLRQHCLDSHKDMDLLRSVWKYGAESIIVYIDVDNLSCNICGVSIQNLNDMKKHLVNVHKKKYNFEFTNRLVPFKLTTGNTYVCEVCKFSFETFGATERHMNTHFRNYVCSECNVGFVTKSRLKTHAKNMHVNGHFLCTECNKTFNSQQKLKNHVETVHNMTKRFKCPYCDVRFTEYFKRQRHLEDNHGVAKLEYPCNVCGKSFNRKYALSRHLKKSHMEERNYQCDICPYNAFTSAELTMHMIKHNGKRIFECKVCKKSYARKKTLKEHMRIHNNDRRFTCSVCGQAFIQKCSLKGHIKTHHPELNELQ